MATKAPLPPFVSGARPLLGHAAEFLKSPETLLDRGLSEHGKIFSLRLPGRPAIVLIGQEHSSFLFAETDKRLSIRRGYPFYRHMFAADIYFLAEWEEYQRQREILLPRFQGGQLDGYLEVMDSHAIAFCDALGDQGECDLPDTLSPVVLRVTADCFLGAGVSARLHDGLAATFRRLAEGVDPILPGWVPAPHLRRSHQARAEIRATICELLAERRRVPQEPPDFLQTLIEATYPDGTPVPDHVRVNLVMVLIHAGHETTTGHLCWALVDLLRHPAELAKVLAEQDELLDPGHRPLGLGQVRQLAVLDRALHETERLHPVTPAMVRRATRSFQYCGYRVPRGAVVLTDPRLSHRLPEVFAGPELYRPDRFLAGPATRKPLIGFGGGVHRCLGTRFAYLEMQVILTRLFERFDFELIDTGVPAEPGQRLKWPQRPCRVRYKKKEPR
jgi:sterol 14alpha-demethylase